MKIITYIPSTLLAIVLSLILNSSVVASELNSREPQQEKVVVIDTSLGTIKVKLYNNTPKHRDMFIKELENGYYDGSLFYRVLNGYMIQGGAKASKNAKDRSRRIGYGNPEFSVDDEISKSNIHKRGALCAPRQPDESNPFKQSDISQFYIVTGRVYRLSELDSLERAVNNPIKNRIRKQYMTPSIRAELKRLKAEGNVEEFRAIANPLKAEIDAAFALDPDILIYTEQQKKLYSTIGGWPQLDNKFTVFGEVISGMSVVEAIEALKCDSNDRPYRDVEIVVNTKK